jgi:hypothetical protein
MRAKALVDIDNAFSDNTLYGSSPPSVFVGEQGYPKVLIGPQVPPILGEETAIMEKPDLWLDRSINEIISMRFSLVRTKKPIPVDSASNPDRVLAETQTLVLSDKPTDSEAILLKRPQFNTVFSDVTLPIGPSAPLDLFELDSNPHVPRAVDRVTSDTDVNATIGVTEMYNDGIQQEHLTRLFSVGLLGIQKNRRLVPTKWSITAIDDIVGKQLHEEVLYYPWISDYTVYMDKALGNTVIFLFIPSEWNFEAMECWLSGPNPHPINDYEFNRGRKNYAKDVAGAYYCTRLPALEHLVKNRKQAGVMAFMEINPREWVPLGVWRFRSIARRALKGRGLKFESFDEAIKKVASYLETPIERWLNRSTLYDYYTTQTKLDQFF